MAGERGDMTHEIFLATQRERAGPLGAYVETLGALLASRGYAMATIREHVRLLADLGRWLELFLEQPDA